MLWLTYLLVLIAVDVGGLVLCAFTLPGTWLMLGAAAIYAWVTRATYLGWRTLAVLLTLAVLGEVLEFTLGGAGAKRAGASRWGIAGGLAGAVLGGIFFTPFIPVPVVGTVIGICLGSFAGAFVIELVLGRPVWHSVRIGFGAFKGRLMGIAAKFTVGLTMFGLSVVAAIGLGPWRARTGTVATTPAAASRPAK